MPELPEVEGYVAGLRAHVAGQQLEAVRLASPFLLRSVTPPLTDFVGATLAGAERLGKRIVLAFDRERFLVLHPMIAGRLRWRPRAAGDAPAKLPGRAALAAFDLERGSLLLTEQGSKKRASLHAVEGRAGLAAHDPGGVEPLEVDDAGFEAALRLEGHTIKRALCDPRQFSGIGNAWSDEILWTAGLSPFLRAQDLDRVRVARLRDATRQVLETARARHVAAARERFPDRVTAFQPEMAVHGRFGEPCPRCGAPVQRITRATGHDFHYCAPCQTGGKLLADRSLSRLMKADWPRTLDELEALTRQRRGEVAGDAAAEPGDGDS